MLQLSLMQMFTVARRRREKSNNAVIGAYCMSHDFAVIWSVVEHCVSQVSVFTFFFPHLVFSEEDFTGEEEMPSFRGERPPAKHIHKHTTDGVSGTCQDVKCFCMLVG